MGILLRLSSRQQNQAREQMLLRYYIGKRPELVRWQEYRLAVSAGSVLVFGMDSDKLYGKFPWNPKEWF